MRGRQQGEPARGAGASGIDGSRADPAPRAQDHPHPQPGPPAARLARPPPPVVANRRQREADAERVPTESLRLSFPQTRVCASGSETPFSRQRAPQFHIAHNLIDSFLTLKILPLQFFWNFKYHGTWTVYFLLSKCELSGDLGDVHEVKKRIFFNSIILIQRLSSQKTIPRADGLWHKDARHKLV